MFGKNSYINLKFCMPDLQAFLYNILYICLKILKILYLGKNLYKEISFFNLLYKKIISLEKSDSRFVEFFILRILVLLFVFCLKLFF